MGKLELPHAVTLFTQQTTTINSLWTVYVAATFAAAGYGFSAKGLSPITAAAVTVGFLAFAFGNWKLIRQGLRINQALSADLRAALGADPGQPFAWTITALAGTANAFWISRSIHILIDACVIVALWGHVTFGSLP